MVQNLPSLLDGLDDLIPAKKNKTLIHFWSSLSSEEDRSSARAELESALESRAISPNDYAFILRVAQNIPWALHALRTHKEKKIVTSAIDVLELTWKRNPAVFLAGVGGHDGLVDLLDKVLPQIHVVRIFRAFGRTSPLLSEHISIVDAVFHAIFPSFGAAKTPLIRHAGVAVDHALTASSLDVVRVVLYCWKASSIHIGTWTKLTVRRPQVLKQILLGQFESLLPSPTTGRVDDPAYLLSNIESLLKHEKDFQFLDRFLSSYKSYLSQNASLPKVDPLLIKLNSEFLLSLIEFLSGKETSVEERIARIIPLCDLLKMVMELHGEDKLGPNKTKRILTLASGEFGRSRWAECWVIAPPKDLIDLTGSITVIGLLLAVFKNIPYSSDNFAGLGWVLTLPRKARFPFCHILHVSKTGESLATIPENKSSFPSFTSEFLSTLHPTHGRLLLEVGLKSKDESFISELWLSSRSKIDTQCLIQAAWVGAERGILGDLGIADEANSKSCIKQAYLFKKNASRSKESDGRVYNSQMALLVAMLSRSPTLFEEILSWALDRYAKDIDTSDALCNWICASSPSGRFLRFDQFFAGPVGLYVTNGTRKTFSKDALSTWCAKGVDMLKIFMNLFRVWVNEPNYGQRTHYTIDGQWSIFATFCFQVVTARIRLIEQIYPTLNNDKEELRSIMLQPMIDIFMDLEKFKIVENPIAFKFHINNCSMIRLFEHLQIPSYVSPIVLPFLVELGTKRENLYRAGWEAIDTSDTDSLILRWEGWTYFQRDRSLLPCGLFITKSRVEDRVMQITSSPINAFPNKRLLFGSIELPPAIGNYVESVLFTDLDAKLSSLTNRLDWDRAQFDDALSKYLRAADSKEVVKRVAKLFDHYEKTEGGRDLTIYLLHSHLIRIVVSNNSVLLTRIVGKWFPQYPPSKTPLELITFDFREYMPPIFAGNKHGEDTLLKALQNPLINEDSRFEHLLGLFNKSISYGYVKLPRTALPTSLARRVAVLAIAWILTTLEIETDIALDSDESDPTEDLVLYAIRYVRVPTAIANTTDGKAKRVPTIMLAAVIDTLTSDQVSLLLRVVFKAEMVGTNLTLMMRVLNIVRTLVRPGVGLDQVWQILDLPAMSSWHRMAFTTGTLRHQGPSGARELVQKLLVFNQKGRESRNAPVVSEKQEMEGQATRMIEGDETEEDRGETLKPEEPNKLDKDRVFFKVSTEQMVMQLLKEAIKFGCIVYNDIRHYEKTNMLEVTPSVFSSVSDLLVEVVIQTCLLHGGKSDDFLDLLKPYIEIAQRLSEVHEITDKRWEDARAGIGPMPRVVEYYGVLLSLLQGEGRNLPWILREAWTKHIVEPVLFGHLNNRTKWLKTAVFREGGSGELERSMIATHSIQISFSAYYRYFAPWFSYEPVEGQEPIIQIIQQRILPASSRAPFQEFLDLVAKNNDGVWKSTEYGRTVVSMTAHATRDMSAARREALEVALISSLMNGFIVAPWLTDKISSVLTTISADLLRSENILFDPTNDPMKVQPLDSFMTFFQAHVREKEQRESKVLLELCSRYVKNAERQESIKSSQGLNGGAAYWKIIVSLKLGLCFQHDTLDGVARALVDVVSAVADGWYICLYLPSIVQLSFQFPSRHLEMIGLVPFVDAFTQEPYCPTDTGMRRSLTFQTAIAVLRANMAVVKADLAVRGAVEKLIERWKCHEDGAVQWLAQTCNLI